MPMHRFRIVPFVCLAVVLIAAVMSPRARASVIPDDIANLALWLRADAVNVADAQQVVTYNGALRVRQWVDSGPNGISPMILSSSNGSLPLYIANGLNGQPVLRFVKADNTRLVVPDGNFGGFDAIDDSILNPGSGGLTVFVVGRTSQTGTARWIAKGGLAADWGGWSISSDLDRDTLPGLTGYAGHGTGDDAAQTASIALNAFNIVSFTMDGSSIVGALNGDANLASGGFGVAVGDNAYEGAVSSSNKLRIGGSGSAVFDGDLAEIIIYNRALSGAERSEVESYLGNKYGITVIPEPMSLSLMGLGAVAMLSRKRRNNSQ